MSRQTAARPRLAMQPVFLIWLLLVVAVYATGVRGPGPGYLPAGADLAGSVIVVDPGHGGRDPGASRDGHLEKDIVLEIGLAARDVLVAAGAVVVMTRETDRDYSEPIPGKKKLTDLAARAELVARVEPDVFVSIHVNSFPEPQWRGPQVFYNEKSEANRLLAGILQDALSGALGVRREPKADHRQYLLKQINVPAACVEAGFISNPEDLAYLVSREGQTRIAWALCDGLARFLEETMRPARGQ